MKERHHCPDGWISENTRDLSISLNGPNGVKDLSIQLTPIPLQITKKGQSPNILFDISLEGEKPWEEIKQLLLQQRQTITFFQTEFSFSEILCDSIDRENKLPRIEPHPAKVAGFWLYMPLPDRDPFYPVEAYDQVIEGCIRALL